jgi:hypothetical protein
MYFNKNTGKSREKWFARNNGALKKKSLGLELYLVVEHVLKQARYWIHSPTLSPQITKSSHKAK